MRPVLPLLGLAAVSGAGRQWLLLAPLPSHVLPHRAFLGNPSKVL